MTIQQLRAELDEWRLGNNGIVGKLNRSLRAAAPALLDLWEACEAERDEHCYSRAPSDKEHSCVCHSNFVDGCPVTAAHAAVVAVLAKGIP